MIVQTITMSGFTAAFSAMGRDAQFTHYGLECLFDYLDEYAEESGKPYELDVIAICTEYTEHNSPAEFFDYDSDAAAEWNGIADDNGYFYAGANGNEDEKLDFIRDYLNDRTMVVCCEEDCILFADY